MVHFVTNGLYRFCEWVTRLAYLNLLWIFFSLAGLVVVGIMPSTIAMFTVTRRWLTEDIDIPIFHTFYQAYKKEFKRSNLFGLVLISMSGLFYIDFVIFGLMEKASAMTFIFSSLLLVFVIMLLFIFPVYVHYDIPVFQTFKYALLIGLSRPLYTISMLAGFIGMIYLLFLHITIVLFFSGSLFAIVLTGLALKAFTNISDQFSKQQVASYK